MKREIWFERALWSYVPCHWKGLAAMVLVISPTLAAIFLARYLAGAAAGWLEIPIFLTGFLTMLRVCKRHSN